jgi:hypothetical protein
MGNIGKKFSLLLFVILAASNLMMIESAFAQSNSKPSIPEFTAKLISSPPESQSVNRTIELSIKNQPSISFYNIRIRVNDADWNLLYPNNNSVPNQSSGEFTILSYRSGYLGIEYQYHLGYKAENLTAGDKIDFQVQAMNGSIQRVSNPNATNQLEMYPYVFTGETSDWSNTQTITIPEGSTSTSTSPNPTLSPTTLGPTYTIIPTSTESNGNSGNSITLPLNIIIIIIAAIMLLAVTLSVLLLRRHRKTANITKWTSPEQV